MRSVRCTLYASGGNEPIPHKRKIYGGIRWQARPKNTILWSSEAERPESLSPCFVPRRATKSSWSNGTKSAERASTSPASRQRRSSRAREGLPRFARPRPTGSICPGPTSPRREWTLRPCAPARRALSAAWSRRIRRCSPRPGWISFSERPSSSGRRRSRRSWPTARSAWSRARRS